MPLNLTKEAVHRGSGMSLYVRLANELRQQILTGDVRPGDDLPSARVICEQTGVSRQVVLQALDILRAEGRIVSRRADRGGPGDRRLLQVAEPRRARVMGPARYRDMLDRLRQGEPLAPGSAFTLENGAKWWDYSEDPRTFTQEAATALDQELLQLDAGAEIWRRRFVRNLRGKPYESVSSAIPLHIAAGTILMDVDADPTPGGTLEALFLNGYDPQLARHLVSSRAPSANERERLQLGSAEMVYDLLEIFTAADGQVLQAARTILPTSGITLEFETDLRAA